VIGEAVKEALEGLEGRAFRPTDLQGLKADAFTPDLRPSKDRGDVRPFAGSPAGEKWESGGLGETDHLLGSDVDHERYPYE
jgi:hypothetical protein